MLTSLWRKNIGKGVIDSSLDVNSQTVSFGDLTGKVIVADYFGSVILDQAVSSVPIWGIDHCYSTNGELILVTGHASKMPKGGEVRIFHDGEQVSLTEIDHPVWDVAIDEKRHSIYATSWGGAVLELDFSGNLKRTIEAPSSVYGISLFMDGKALVNVDRHGVFEIGDDGLSKFAEGASNCYNLCWSESDQVLFSGGYGPYIRAYSDKGDEVFRVEGSDVLSIFVKNGLFATGDQNGWFKLFTQESGNEPIVSIHHTSSIWNISFDDDDQKIFLACGDGTVLCYHCDIDVDTASEIDLFFSLSHKRDARRLLPILQAQLPSAVSAPLIFKIITDGNVIETELDECAAYINSSEGTLDPFIVALVHFAGKDFDNAMLGFQSVETSDVNFHIAGPLLVQCLIAKGEIELAHQYIHSNIKFLPLGWVKDAAAVFDSELRNSKNTLATPSGLASLIPRVVTQSTSRSITKKLFPALDALSHSPLEEAGNGVEYSPLTYFRYEYSKRSDSAKKILERIEVEKFLSNQFGGMPVSVSPPLCSLDVGCATGRYPLWFSTMGFRAAGYDINDDAINFSKRICESNPDIRIEKKNIVDEHPEEDTYSVVTCMMGTFNHIPDAIVGSFLEWIYKSLKVGGVFIFSVWNAECSYLGQLDLYTREDKESLSRNLKSPEEYKILLKEMGFLASEEVPACFLPDECFDAWLGEISEAPLIEIDQHLKSQLSRRNAQMLLFCGTKP